MVYTGDMVLSQHRHEFFPLAAWSPVGDTDISETIMEASIAVHRARETLNLCVEGSEALHPGELRSKGD